MATVHMITVDTPNETAVDVKNAIISESLNKFQAGQKMMAFWRSLMGGGRSAKVKIGTGAVRATGTVTFSSIVATNTVTINGVVFTGSDTPSGEAQFETGVSDTSSATSLAAKITAHSTVGLIVSATSAAEVVTITAIQPGLLGNAVTLAISANGSVSAARMAGGTDGSTSKTHYYGSSY